MPKERFEISGRKFIYYTHEQFPEVKTIRQAAIDFAARFQCEPTCVNGADVVGFCENTGDPIFTDDKYQRYDDGPVVLTERNAEYDKDVTLEG